jgi:hypothetical protein
VLVDALRIHATERAPERIGSSPRAASAEVVAGHLTKLIKRDGSADHSTLPGHMCGWAQRDNARDRESTRVVYISGQPWR